MHIEQFKIFLFISTVFNVIENVFLIVPRVLTCCSEFIETAGMVDGIYRLSGIASNIQKLRVAFDEDRVPNLKEDKAVLQVNYNFSFPLKSTNKKPDRIISHNLIFLNIINELIITTGCKI